jgi:hypothetical protein
MAKFIRSRTSEGMTDKEIIEALRLAFQNRVSNGEWTISERETEDMLLAYPVHLLLEAFTSTGAYLRLEKRDNLIYYGQDETLDLLRHDVERIEQKIKKRAESTK